MNDRPVTGMVAAAGVLSPAGTGTRSKGVTREMVVARALTIVDTEGLAALTMRRLAHDLGVGVATVYAVVPSKEELFQSLADTMIVEVPLQGSASSVTDALVEYFLAVHEMLQRHPAVAQLSAVQPVLSERAFRMQERILVLLRNGGLDPEAAAAAYSTLGSYVLGFTLTRISRLDNDRRDMLSRLPAEQFPELHAAAPYFATHSTDERQFVDGLRTILAGLFPAVGPGTKRTGKDSSR